MSSHYFKASAIRRALVSTAFIVLAVSGTVTPAMSHAAAPMAATQAPGYFRMMLGAFEVTALSDGTLDLPVDTLLSADARQTRADVASLHLAVPLETSFNAYLINTGEKLVLITDRRDAESSRLSEWAREHGAPDLAVPKKIIKVAEVPVLGTGKTDYVAIQQMAELEAKAA